MTFLNFALVFGALGFLAPLVIHILNRSRFRTIEWGAMHLLESVIKVNHKRFRIEQLILLLIRCAIPVLLALCLARPVLTGSRILEGNAPLSLVVLLDDSYSMDSRTEAGTQFEEAVAAAQQFIQATSRGSEVAVIRTGGTVAPLFDQPVFDSSAVVRRLKQLQGGYGASDIQSGMDRAFATLAGMTHARRELIIISDFQSADWEPIQQNPDAIAAQLSSMSVPATVSFFPIAQPKLSNVAVESLDFSRRALGVDQQLPVRVNLRNYGSSTFDSSRVVLRVNGTEAETAQVSIAPNSSTQVLLPVSFQTPGSHVIEVEAVVDDQLATDNKFAAAVTVWETLNVLLVDGDPSSKPLAGETDFLSVALSPFTFGRVQLSDLIQTRTISSKDLNADQLQSSRVLILANVSKLQEDQVTAIADYVRSGGSLVVCPGNRIDQNWYNEKLGTAGQALLPAAIGPLAGKTDDSGTASHTVAERFDHPALTFFNDPTNGDLSTAEIRQWHQLIPDDSAETIILARLETGDPLLVEQPFGQGVVQQWATACDADWSDLPLRPVFVPLVQQLITTMAARLVPPQNIQVGQTALAVMEKVEPAEPPEPTSSNSAETEPVTVQHPNGTRQAIQAESQTRSLLARMEQTRRPGTYTFSSPQAKTLHVVAETSRVESDLTVLDEAQLQTLAEKISAEMIPSTQAYLEQDRLRRHGREVWKAMLSGLLLLMFLEVVLQQRFSRVRV